MPVPVYTLEYAQGKLTEAQAAIDAAVTRGLSYTIGSRSRTNYALLDLQKERDYWQGVLIDLGRKGARMRLGVPA